MNFTRPTMVIIAYLLTIAIIQGKAIDSSLTNPKDYVKQLLSILNVENEYVRFLSFMKVQPPENDEMRALYSGLFSTESYLSDLTKIYAKYYTSEEIRHLANFYSSPLGKKSLQIDNEINKQMEDIMLNKISDYIFTSTEHGYDVLLP